MTYKEYLQNRRPYQEQGHLFLLERKHALLYYKPGKGKTYPCIDALLDVNEDKHGKAKVLILSTADAIKNMWNVEIVPQNILPENTVTMTFNSAILEYNKLKLLKVKWDAIIIDECHKVKSHNSKISKLVYMLTTHCEYVWGLSGTPRGNNDVDIFCQLHNMHIDQWGDITYSYFVEECCDVDKKLFHGTQITIPTGVNSKYKAGFERNIAMNTQRVDYTDEDNMPLLNVNEIRLDFKPSEYYEKLEKGVFAIADYESTITRMVAINKLHQAANGFLYIPDETDENKRTIKRFEHNKKLDWLQDNLTDEPTVIVYLYEADLEDLTNSLARSSTEDIDKFKRGQTNILLLQCSRCESFNLQMCKHIIFYNLDYSYIKYDQMIHRVWRMGQNENVTIIILMFKNSVEEKIWKIVKGKQTLSDLFYAIKEGYNGR